MLGRGSFLTGYRAGDSFSCQGGEAFSTGSLAWRVFFMSGREGFFDWLFGWDTESLFAEERSKRVFFLTMFFVMAW